MSDNARVPPGQQRFTVAIGVGLREKLSTLTSRANLSQTEVLEVLIETANADQLDAEFEKRRQKKVTSKVNAGQLAKTIKSLSPEQQAAIQQIINQGQKA